MRIGWSIPVRGCYHHVLATPRAGTAICGARARRWYEISRRIGPGEQVCLACADVIRAAAATLADHDARRRIQQELDAHAAQAAAGTPRP